MWYPLDKGNMNLVFLHAHSTLGNGLKYLDSQNPSPMPRNEKTKSIQLDSTNAQQMLISYILIQMAKTWLAGRFSKKLGEAFIEEEKPTKNHM